MLFKKVEKTSRIQLISSCQDFTTKLTNQPLEQLWCSNGIVIVTGCVPLFLDSSSYGHETSPNLMHNTMNEMEKILETYFANINLCFSITAIRKEKDEHLQHVKRYVKDDPLYVVGCLHLKTVLGTKCYLFLMRCCSFPVETPLFP